MYCVLLCVILFYCCYCLCVIMYCILLCVVLFYCCHCLCVVVMCLYLLLYVVDDVLLIMCLLWRVRDWCACLMKGLSYQTYHKTFCRLEPPGRISGFLKFKCLNHFLLDNSHTKNFLVLKIRKYTKSFLVLKTRKHIKSYISENQIFLLFPQYW